MKKWLSSLLPILLLAGCTLFAADEAAPVVTAETVPAATEPAVIAEGNLVPRDYATLTFNSPGKVHEILVQEGDRVGAGDVLARLGNREQAEATLAAAQLERLAAQQQLDDLDEKAALATALAYQALLDARAARITAEAQKDAFDMTAYETDLDDARIEVTDKKDALQTAQENYDEYKDLDAENAVRKTYEGELDEAQKDYNEALRARDLLIWEHDRRIAALEAAARALAGAQQAYDAVREGPDPDQTALLQARITSAQAQISAAGYFPFGAAESAPAVRLRQRPPLRQGYSVRPHVPGLAERDQSRQWKPGRISERRRNG